MLAAPLLLAPLLGGFPASGSNLPPPGPSQESWSGLAELAAGLGWGSRVSLVVGDGGDPRAAARAVKAAARGGLLLTALTWAEHAEGGGAAGADLPVAYWSRSRGDLLQTFFSVLREARHPTEGLLLLTDYPVDSEVEEAFEGLDLSRAFFAHRLGSSPAAVRRVQSFRGRRLLVTNRWEREAGGRGRFRRVYDFQGAPLTLLATPNDFPWLYPVPCPHRPGLACGSVGGDVSILNAFREMFNFTVEVHIQVDDNWGTLPAAEETGEANATFSGVFGSILRDEYDRCSTVFRPSPERALRLDFSVGVVYARRYYVMDVGKASKFDWTLYLRPFRTLTWYCCLAMTAVVVLVHHGLGLANRSVKRPSPRSRRIENVMRLVSLLGWLCFLVVDTYYEGALTMFFTTGKDLPFNSIEEALDLYPDYKLLIVHGHENVVRRSLEAGVEGMERQLQWMREDEDILQRDLPTLLESLKRPGTYTLVDPREVGAVLSQVTVMDLSLQKLFLSPANSGYYSAIYPKGSPWKAPLDMGYHILRRSGLLDHIISHHAPDNKLDGKAADGNGDGDGDGKEQLDLRQTGLAFLIWFLVAAVAGVLFAAEVVAARNLKLQRYF